MGGALFVLGEMINSSSNTDETKHCFWSFVIKIDLTNQLLMSRAPSRPGACGLGWPRTANPIKTERLRPCMHAWYGVRHRSSAGWRHVRSGPCWSALEQWSAGVGTAWLFARSRHREGAVDSVVGRCFRCRSDWIVFMSQTFSTQKKSEAGFGFAAVSRGRRSVP